MKSASPFFLSDIFILFYFLTRYSSQTRHLFYFLFLSLSLFYFNELKIIIFNDDDIINATKLLFIDTIVISCDLISNSEKLNFITLETLKNGFKFVISNVIFNVRVIRARII